MTEALVTIFLWSTLGSLAAELKEVPPLLLMGIPLLLWGSLNARDSWRARG